MIDMHCHLQDSRFTEPIEKVIDRARSRGVTHFVCCGTNPGDWEAVSALANKFSRIVPFYGIHPWYVDNDFEDSLGYLTRMLSQRPCGIGEIGLDYTEGMADRKLQICVCRKQLKIAAERKLPVAIHCRKAWSDLINLLDQIRLSAGGLIHAWSGSSEMISAFEKRGMYISFGGSITRVRNKKAHKAVRCVSSERMLIETDSPDMVPEGIEAKVNEPCYLKEVAKAAAFYRDGSFEQIDNTTSRNAQNLLRGLIRL